jgi:adenine-specific DNA-methyltransferase
MTNVDLLSVRSHPSRRETRPFFKHHPKNHSARWTEEYLFNQLIPYIGNKRKLLDLITQAIRSTGIRKGTFLDLFAGSGVVSRLAKRLGFRIICNDWEPFTRDYNSAFIIPDGLPPFRNFGGCENAYRMLNRLEPIDGYCATYYAPRSDSNPDVERERMFFTHANAARIDAIREKIEEWSVRGTLTNIERSILLASLIYSVSYVSNTSGVFKGFHRGWGGKTQTALYRIKSRMKIVPPILFGSGVHGHEVRCSDASRLAESTEADIAYVDPPYNQHQYGANYHILNTVALWDKPPVNRSILKGGKTVNKSAIRKDWRTERRSKYCYTESAAREFERLIEKIRAKYVLISYSSDGIIPIDEMIDFLRRCGTLRRLGREYKRYRVSSTRPSAKSHNTEFVLVLKKG